MNELLLEETWQAVFSWRRLLALFCLAYVASYLQAGEFPGRLVDVRLVEQEEPQP